MRIFLYSLNSTAALGIYSYKVLLVSNITRTDRWRPGKIIGLQKIDNVQRNEEIGYWPFTIGTRERCNKPLLSIAHEAKILKRLIDGTVGVTPSALNQRNYTDASRGSSTAKEWQDLSGTGRGPSSRKFVLRRNSYLQMLFTMWSMMSLINELLRLHHARLLHFSRNCSFVDIGTHQMTCWTHWYRRPQKEHR